MIKKNDFLITKRLFLFFKPYWFLIFLTIILSLILASVPVLTVRYIKQILDEVFLAKDGQKLIMVCFGVIVLYALTGVFKYFQDFLTRYISESVSRTVRNNLYKKFTYFSFDYHVKNKLGHMMSKVINDVVYLNDGLTAITLLAKEPITIIALLVYACYLDWKLMLVSALVAPVLAVFFMIVGKKVQKYSRKSLEKIADLSSVVQETFSGIRIIKAFILEKKMNRKFASENNDYFRVRIKTARIEVLSSPLTETICIFVGAGILFLGGIQVVEGTKTVGSFFAFLAAVGLVLDPLRKINIANLRINTAIAGAKRIFEVLDYDEKILKVEKPRKLMGIENNIEFVNVGFTYGDHLVLDKISFKVDAGKSVAFVGASGVGKTSLVNLIPRFYDICEGKILIDGVSLNEFNLTSLRSKIALVTQETFLFNDSVYNNINYGNLKATKEEVIEAAKAANAHNFIMELPDNYDTYLGDRGMNLSGGQRQRLAIARALLKNAPILILDEATSSLDTEAEKLVQGAIENLMKGRTTFVIAHRLSTIKNADKIIVLKDGKIFESGTHGDLVSKMGEYFQQYNLQKGF